MGSVNRSWGDHRTIKPGKLSALGSDILQKQIIAYTSDFIEEAKIGRTPSRTDSIDGSHIHSWNDEYHASEYQLDQWGVEKLFQNSYEVIIKQWKLYIKYRGKLNIKNKSLCHVSYQIWQSSSL